EHQPRHRLRLRSCDRARAQRRRLDRNLAHLARRPEGCWRKLGRAARRPADRSGIRDRRHRGQGLRGDVGELPLPVEHRQRFFGDRILLHLVELRLRAQPFAGHQIRWRRAPGAVLLLQHRRRPVAERGGRPRCQHRYRHPLPGRSAIPLGTVPFTPADVKDQSRNAIGMSPWPDELFHGEVATFRVYDRALSAEEVQGVATADAAIHAEALTARAEDVIDSLDLTDIETDTHVDLPTAAGAVSWTSENSDVVAADGTGHPPLPGEEPVSVDLPATATVRGYSASATITVTVNPSDETANERIERLAEQIIIPPVVRSGTDLPAAPPGTSIESVQVSNGEVS